MKGGATMNDEQQKMLEKIEHNQGTIMLLNIATFSLLFLLFVVYFIETFGNLF